MEDISIGLWSRWEAMPSPFLPRPEVLKARTPDADTCLRQGGRGSARQSPEEGGAEEGREETERQVEEGAAAEVADGMDDGWDGW